MEICKHGVPKDSIWVCPECYEEIFPIKTQCPRCKGTGKVHCGHGIHLNECPSICSGTKKCPDCNGCGKTNNGVGDERKG